MAPPDSGMRGFVKDRNGDVNPSLADLKRHVPSPGAKADKKPKSKHNNTVSRERSQTGRQGRLDENTSARSNNSSTENLSTTASTSRQRTGKDHHLETRSHSYDRRPANGDQQQAIFGGTDYDDQSDMTQDLPDDPLASGKRNFDKMMAEMEESKRGAGSPTIAQTQIKGDSYPPTSAGVPSVTDQPERAEVRVTGGLQNLPTHAAVRMNFGSRNQRQQQQFAGAGPQLPTASSAKVQHPAPSHQPQDIGNFDPETAMEYDASAGFSFGRAPNVKKEVVVQSSHRPRQTVPPQPLPTEVKAAAPRAHREIDKPAIVQVTPVTDDYLPTPATHTYHHEKQSRVTEVQDYPDQPVTSARHASLPAQGPASEALTEEDQVEQFEQQEFSDEPLDYGPSELYNKDYASLKAEPFDHHPNAQPFVVSDLPDSSALVDKIAHLAHAEPKTQSEFFASLNIDEWEEAGDWFLDRFGETIKRLKEVRREKRKASRAFEDEIEVREVAVSKKRALTRAAMVDMKSNGAAVLTGTPGKKK